jgi:hypothetical protein
MWQTIEYFQDVLNLNCIHFIISIKMNLRIHFFLGPVFGYQDYFNGLGIIMDTYSNNNGVQSVNIPPSILIVKFT